MIGFKQNMVYQEIKSHILTGKLKDKTKVTERGLAEQMGVTRIPIRESLVKLEQDGLIKKIPSVGYIVDNYSAEEMEEAMLLRFTIECQAAVKAAQKATKEDVAELRKLNEALRDAGLAHNFEAAAECDREFHMGIIKVSGSKLLNKLYSIISIPVFHHRPKTNLANIILTFEGHDKIIEAIENKDKERAFYLAFINTPGRASFKNTFYNDLAYKALKES